DSARDLAGIALGVGNTANNAAGAAQSTANQALTHAGLAQTSANNANAAAGAAQTTANTALGLAQNSAQYSPDGSSLTLNSNGGAGTVISNVRAGQAANDAVNVEQLQQTSQATLTSANTFANQQVLALQALMNQAFQNGLCNFTGGTVSCGTGSIVEGQGATAIGMGAQAVGNDTTAIGAGAEARFAGSVAIGAGARALADPTTAVGNNAVAAGNNSVALGANTLATGANSVALGQGSVATRDNSVSVGDASAGLTRQITNVASGVMPTDAANVGQLRQAVSAASDEMRKFSARGVAAALAMPQMPALTPGKQWVGVAVGNYSGENALGATWGYQVTDALNVGVGVSGAMGGGANQLATRLQLGYAW
ncbi:MAG TPA: adhesin, partial [Burkholderiaceae bacterium]|nr:adhesin [Burkholderiaceae bacterium]